jgi:hypothetical protein
MIIDLQGDKEFFTDPILLTNISEPESSDPDSETTNTGALGMIAFFN